MSAKMHLVSLNPKDVQVPDVRVTSSWDPEILDMFKESVKDMGIQNPIIVTEQDGNYWLVDGLHRLQEAKLADLPKIPAAVTPGGMKEVMLKNLALNRMRGKTPATQMCKVVTFLQEKEDMKLEDIAKRTGLRPDYIEQLMSLGRAAPEILEALDDESIGVGHAFQIARVQESDAQLRLLQITRQYRLKVTDLKDVVEDTIKILQARAKPDTPVTRPPPPPTPTIKCSVCDQDWPIKKVTGATICLWCYGLALEVIRQRMSEGWKPGQQTKDLAGQATGQGSDTHLSVAGDPDANA